jgi:cell wall assembly regulator SMI1
VRDEGAGAVDAAVDRILAWCERWAPEALDSVRPPADPADVASVEAEVGVLPPAVGRWWARCGGLDLPGPLPVLGLGPEAALDRWRALRRAAREVLVLPQATDVDPGLVAAWVHPGWLPLTDDGAGNHACVDLDPAEGGRVGQVLAVLADHPRRPLLAGSWAAFLGRQARALEEGDLVATEDRGRFFGVLRRVDLIGPLAGLTIRGEAPEDRIARLVSGRGGSG